MPRKKAPCFTRLNGKLRAAKIGLPEKYKRYTNIRTRTLRLNVAESRTI
jgi:hypothetical protein